MILSEGVGRFVGDRYHIVRELGRGGMGVVYLGRDLRRDMDVAIKFRGITHHDATLWLKREFRSVASLRHPNLVELYELVAHEQSCYFTMEYLPGVDPRRWVARPRVVAVADSSELPTQNVVPLQEAHTALSDTPVVSGIIETAEIPDVDFSKVRGVLAQLAEGLAFLHARGVIHRDVKPSNVIVGETTVKLLDFGLALERRRAEEEASREARIVGTAAYLAPEYLERLIISPAMDVYSLGVLAFELVTGAPPFGGALHVLSRLKRKMALPRASSLNPDVPGDLDELIDQMLGGDPLRRPTALEVAVRLTGSLSYPRAVRRPTPFVGREAELARIAAQIADGLPRGRLVLVTGPSGVGKTALIEEALARARTHETGDAPMVVWRGRCHERERVPYRAFDFIIDDLATELAQSQKLATSIEHAGALGRVFPALGGVLGVSTLPVDDLRVERERALVAMTQLFHQVVERGLVVIDDLQWADDDSLELLALLVERVGRPLTIVATWTAEGTLPDAIQSLLERLGEAAVVIDVPPLDADSLAELLAKVAPHAPADRILAAARQAAGSPYLAELIGGELEAEGQVDPRHAEARRLERLTSSERMVAELAALSVGVATFEQLRALAELPSAQLQSVLHGLEDGRILKVTPSASGDPVYTFYHQRLRDAAHDAIAADARRDGHRRYAELFERDGESAERLAYHWEHAGEPARAAMWAVTAADAARAQLAWSLAADWYGRAQQLGRPCREQRAECLFLGGKLAAAATEFEVLAQYGGDRWLVRAAESYIKLGEIEHGLAILDGLLTRRGQPRARGRAASTVRALAVAARWLAPAPRRRVPADEVLTATYRVIASFLSTPYPIESFEYVLRGIHTAKRAGNRDAHGLGMAMLAAYLAVGSLGRFGDRAIETAHRLSAQSGAPYPRMVTAGAEGILATLRGDWAGMRRAHADGDAICKRLGLERSWEASFLRTYQALGEYYAGEPARALALLGDLAEHSNDLISRAMLGSYRGRAHVLDGNLGAARSIARDLDRQPAARRGMASIYRQVFNAELALAEGDWPRAEAIGHELVRTTREKWLSAIPAVSAMVDTLISTAEIGRGDRASASRAKSRARALHRRARSSFYAATALRLVAQAELRLGHAAAARDVLANAAAVAAERGGNVDRLAILALSGTPPVMSKRDPLAFAVRWSTGGVVELE